MEAFEQFTALLVAFGTATGRELRLDETDSTCSFLVDDACCVNLTWLPTAEEVVLWTSIGGLPEDEHRISRATRLLEMNDGERETDGFTLAISPEDRRVVAHDHRSLREIDSPDRLAVWVDTLVKLANRIEDDFEQNEPFWDDSSEEELEIHAN